MKLMVAQVFNLCTGAVLLSLSGTGFHPVNPLRIIGVAELNELVRDGIEYDQNLFMDYGKKLCRLWTFY